MDCCGFCHYHKLALVLRCYSVPPGLSDEHQLQPFQSQCSVKMSFMLLPRSYYLLHLHAFFWMVRAAKLGGKLHVSFACANDSFAQQGDDRGERVDFYNLFLYLILHGDVQSLA